MKKLFYRGSHLQNVRFIFVRLLLWDITCFSSLFAGTGFGLGLVFSLTFFKSKCDSYFLFNIMSSVHAFTQQGHLWKAHLHGCQLSHLRVAKQRMWTQKRSEWVEHLPNSPGHWVRVLAIVNMISFKEPVLYASESFGQIDMLNYF